MSEGYEWFIGDLDSMKNEFLKYTQKLCENKIRSREKIKNHRINYYKNYHKNYKRFELLTIKNRLYIDRQKKLSLFRLYTQLINPFISDRLKLTQYLDQQCSYYTTLKKENIHINPIINCKHNKQNPCKCFIDFWTQKYTYSRNLHMSH